MFNIVCLETGETIATGFENGRDAAAKAQELTNATGKKHQPRPVKSDIDWRAREQGRFDDGTYTKLPWVNERWYVLALETNPELRDHFAHVSMKEPGKLAFTENADKGAVDRQTRMRPGRYLSTYWTHVLTKSGIKDLANNFAAQYEPVELRFAHTADEIERVYTNGPNSCMSHEACEYRSPFHPVRVYAAGDLAVAYLGNKNEDGEETITARAVAWPEKKRYNRIYGDESRLGAALDRAGYSQGSLCGARMTRHKYERGFVAPYIDQHFCATDDGEHLIIDESGDVKCENTNGLAEVGQCCDNCGDYMNEDDSVHMGDTERSWCRYCADNHAYYCDYHGMLHSGNDYVNMDNGESWCSDAFERCGFECEATNRNYHLNECVTLECGTHWSQAYFDNNGFVCDDCGDNFDRDNMHADHADCCDSCGEERDAENGHRTRQGRDESPLQTELALKTETLTEAA